MHMTAIIHAMSPQFIQLCRYIKLTSPLINVLICLGAVVLYCETVLLLIPVKEVAVLTVVCNVRKG